MTKTKKLTVAVALCVATVACSVTGGLLLRHTAYAEDSDYIVSEEADRIAYGAGWSAEASAKVKKAFADKLGADHPAIQILKANSAGDALAFAVEKDNSIFVYNSLEDKIYEVKNREEPYAQDFVFKAKNESRRIGAPVSELLDNITVTGWAGEGQQINITSGTKVYLFETGLLYDSGNAIEKRECVLEKISETEYTAHPFVVDQDVISAGRSGKGTINGKEMGFVGNIDGEWHALRTARASRNSDDKLVVKYNFRAGCNEFVFNNDWTVASRMAYAGQNFDKDGNRVNLPVETFTLDIHLFNNANSDNFGEEGGGSKGVSNKALNTYKDLSGNADATQEDVRNAFKASYVELVGNGIIPGYRCSVVKMWDNVMCVDYKYSPNSRYGFNSTGSADRERMYTLTYSGVQNKVYGVGDDIWDIWKGDLHKEIGAPISNVLTNVTISNMPFKRIQLFEKGYIYENAKGALVVERGVTTGTDYQNFEYPASPAVPAQYGAEVARYEVTENNRKVVYINYKKGAVKAVETAVKLGYLYDMHPGRNFVKDGDTYKAQILSFDQIYNESDFTCQSGYVDIFNDNGETKGAKSLMIDKIKSLLEQGFFPGFLESNFQNWNNVACQQFMYGDSTSSPWGGDSRTNISALVYNDIQKKVYLLKDAFMERWAAGDGAAHNMLGAPASDEFTLDANKNFTFQYFVGASYENEKAFAVCAGYNEATYYTPNDSQVADVNPEKYIESVNELTKPLAGVAIDKDIPTTYKVGGYATVDYTVDGASADATITLTSSDEAVATVMADGSVEFLKAGTVTITVTVSNGAKTFTDSITFTVSK